MYKKTRFEVLKRDKFQCQYCGQKAPDVILEVDHITPKSKGGTDDLLNLTTSCFDCNRGKTDIELDDNSVVQKQRNQAELLQQKSNQIKMMADWIIELNSVNTEVTEIDRIMSELSGIILTDTGKENIKPLIKKFGFQDVSSAIVNELPKLKEGDDLLDKVEKQLKWKDKSDEDKHWAYSFGILKNRINYYDSQKAMIYINQAKENGLHKDDFRQFVINCKNWTEYREFCESYNFN